MAVETARLKWRAPPDWLWCVCVFLLALAALAPQDGVIAVRQVKPGQFVPVATAAAALIQDRIAVFKALGGGWHNTETAAQR